MGIIALFVRDIWHKYHGWYFKIVSNFNRLTAREITYNNFEISPVVFMPNITTNYAITYTKARSENGCGKWHFLVWNTVRIWRTGRHTPTKNSQEYHPRGQNVVTVLFSPLLLHLLMPVFLILFKFDWNGVKVTHSWHDPQRAFFKCKDGFSTI